MVELDRIVIMLHWRKERGRGESVESKKTGEFVEVGSTGRGPVIQRGKITVMLNWVF
jgi:hypothetical protein